MTVFAILLMIGAVLGLAMGALSNPLIYRWVFGGRVRSADHEDSDGVL